MDDVFKSEVIVVVLENDEGVYFEQFAELFQLVHGYQLELTNYGYESLKDLLDDMKDEIEVVNINGQQLIKYRQSRHLNVISPCMDIPSQRNDLDMSETCNAATNKFCPQIGDIPLDVFPKEHLLCEQNTLERHCYKSSPPAIQSTLHSQDNSASGACATKETHLAREQTPSKEIVKLISQKIRSHPTGLRANKLKQYILQQHKIDLELYSQQLGYADMVSMLKQIPLVKFSNTSGKNIIIASYFLKNLSEDQRTPSAKDELLPAGPSSTSRSPLPAKHSTQPEVSSNRKKANKEPCQYNDPIISETPEPAAKTDNLFTKKVNCTQPISSREDSIPSLLVVNSAKLTSLNTTHKPSEYIAKLISETISSNPLGLNAKALRNHIMNYDNIDLELYSQQLGYKDMLSMLNQIPGIGFAENSKKNVLIALGSHDKANNSQPVQPKKDPFCWNKIIDVLRFFPSGIRAEKLKQHVLNAHRIDMEVLSQKLGYRDMPSMLSQVPGITPLNDELFIASDILKSKAQHAQGKKCQFSEKLLVDFLKPFPLGLKAEKLRELIQNKYKFDLMNYSKEQGSTDLVGVLRNIPGITVHEKVIMASPATNKATPCPKNAGTGVPKNPHVAIKKPQVSQTATKPSVTKPTGTGQQIPVPARQIPLPNPMNDIPQNVQPGLRPNVSYASACASNLRKDQIHVQSIQDPPIFNVQKVQTAKAAQPNSKEVAKVVLPNLTIKDNIRQLLKSHTHGLSMFHLKTLYLLTFQQPLVHRGLSTRKLLLTMTDIAKIKGVGVQMKVFPALPESDPSASANKSRDSTPQGTAALVAKDGKNEKALTQLQDSSPLSIKNSTEHTKHSAAVPVTKHHPSSSVYSHTELTGQPIPISTTEDIRQQMPLLPNYSQPNTERLVTTAISHPGNNPSALGSQVSKTNESPDPAGNAGNLNDLQWPSLPQKYNILKEIQQRTKLSYQLHDKPKPAATCKPQAKDNSAQTLLQAHQGPYTTNGKMDYGQAPQTSDLTHPVLPSDFTFVMEETGFSFVMANGEKDKKPVEMGRTGPTANTFTASAQVSLALSGADALSNKHSTPLQPNQSAYCNVAAQITESAPEASEKPVNVSMQQKSSDFSSQKVSQRTDNQPVISGTTGSVLPMLNQNISQSQHNPTNYNKNVDSLPLELNRQQPQCMQPCLASGQMVSMPSKEQQEASSSKSLCDYEQRGSTSPPSKQEVVKSDLNNRSGLALSPKSQSLETATNSKTKTNVGTPHVLTKQTTSNGRQVSSPVPQVPQQVPSNSVNTEGSPIPPTLQNAIDLNSVNGQIDLKTQKVHSETRDGFDGTKTPPSSVQQNANTDQVYTHQQTVTEPFQTHLKRPHPHTSSLMKQISSPSITYRYYNSCADGVPEQEKSFPSHQQVSHSLDAPRLSGYPDTPCDQQDSSEESTKTWQTDREHYCRLL
ncbi:uncharacterized protein ACMZJ9_018873 [Mantella aurantiaca]